MCRLDVGVGCRLNLAGHGGDVVLFLEDDLFEIVPGAPARIAQTKQGPPFARRT